MRCSMCDQDLADEEFPRDRRRPSGRAGRCKGCQKILSKAHYERNKEQYRRAGHERNKALFEWFYSYKAGLKCEKCGFSHPAVLDFHHRDGSDDKIATVSRVLVDTKSKDRVLEEIAKCEVLCANCHRIAHYEEKRDRGEMVDA
jgi:hypothetical protein